MNYPWLLCLLLLLSASCKNPDKEVSILTENQPSMSDSMESGLNNLPPNLILSNDSLFTIELSKTVAKLNNGFVSASGDSLQYTCAELKRTDGRLLLLSNYQTRSPSMPEHYLALTFQDSSTYKSSEWSLVERLGESTRFYFALDEFDDFGKHCVITLGYPGWIGDDRIIATFNVSNFSGLIQGLQAPASNAAKANKKWFSSHRR